MMPQGAIAHIERLVIDEQAKRLAILDVDHRLPLFGVAISDLGIGQRHGLVDTVQVGAGQRVRLPFVQVAAQTDVPVGKREDRLGVRQLIEIQLRLDNFPRRDRVGIRLDHRSSSSSARSLTTMSAPPSRRASAWPTRSTPTTHPKSPARPASTPATASSNT